MNLSPFTVCVLVMHREIYAYTHFCYLLINGVKILQIRKVNRDQRITKYASKLEMQFGNMELIVKVIISI